MTNRNVAMIKTIFLGGEEGEIFRNRKMYFSVNVQVIGDANLYIMNLVARWPGSAHDATIFNNSTARMRFESGHFPNSLLLGKLHIFLLSIFVIDVYV